tara:strand:+ start:293 stop:1165 length:873 start_codon:yes stop_codon:yes gene_type:complete
MYKLIAEIGGNHKGEIEVAKKMIKIAATECKADIIKFQKRSNKTLLTSDEYSSPHPNPENSYGKTYGEHREYLEFSIEEHLILKKECEKFGSEYSTSVWDIKSAEEVVNIKPNSIKIPSAQNLNFDLIEFIYTSFEGDIHISLGMTTSDEIEMIVDHSKKFKRNTDIILYHCTSDYPVKFNNLNLLEIKNLIIKYSKDFKGIGFSGHHNGIAMDISALTLGAKYVERHFTLDRSWKGTDHAASLEPQGLRKLKRDMNNLELALKYKENRNSIDESEKIQFEKLKWKKSVH